MNRALIGVLLLATVAAAQSYPLADDAVIRESLAIKGPLLGHRWLEKTGRRDYLLRQSWLPTDDSGLLCVGRWSYGPSLKVSLRVTPDDTTICLTRGSGASLIRFRSQDSVTLDLLGDVDFAGLPRRAVLSDTLVIAGIHSGGSGLEVHGVSNPASPNLLSRVDLPMVNDIAVNDTLVYVACEDDTLRIYNIADPRSPVRVGACRDSCDIYMSHAGNYCYLVHSSGIDIVDVQNPASPHRAGHIGGVPLAVFADDTTCYVTYPSGLQVFNVRNPASPQAIGSLSRPETYDLTMAATSDTLLFTSLLDAISVANPRSPRLLGHVDVPADMEYGVAVVPALDYALVADYTDGVVAVDIRDPAAPVVDTAEFGAGYTQDIYIDGNHAYLASTYTGLSVLDVSDPTRPNRVGRLDIMGLGPQTCDAVAARDSFAYLPWFPLPQFRSVDVSNPSHPALAGGADVTNAPKDMVIRDTFIYVAEQSFLQVVNVARPREPVLVGSCVGDGVAVVLQDSFAYTAAGAIRITNVARPDSPFVVATIAGHGASGIAARDTFLYFPYAYDTLFVYSVANPAQPRLLAAVQTGVWPWDIVLGDARAYVALSDGNGVEVFDLTDPGQPVSRGQTSAPYDVRRLAYRDGLLYAALWDAGVAIYETTAVAVGEPADPHHDGTALSATPNPTRGQLRIRLPASGPGCVTVRDVAGRSTAQTVVAAGEHECWLDISNQPAGVYVVEMLRNGKRLVTKLVKE